MSEGKDSPWKLNRSLGKYLEIERNNRILLEKMASIMHGLKNQKLYHPPSKSLFVLRLSRTRQHGGPSCTAQETGGLANLPGEPGVSEAFAGEAEHLQCDSVESRIPEAASLQS